MSEGATFTDLVREAFIDPLRSVLIVDDQYPTWEEILNANIVGDGKDSALAARSAKKEWITQPSEPLGVIREFRDRKPGFVIDIHDALAATDKNNDQDQDPQESPAELADHLHQSDLLVLDYNLEGDAGGLRGKKARQILREVLFNKHFNLIILHTGEDDLSQVMSECLISLMQSCTSQFDHRVQEGLDKLDETLDDLEAEGTFDRNRLEDIFSTQEYLEVRKNEHSKRDTISAFMRGEGRLANLQAWGGELGLKGGLLKSFLYWAIREFEKNKLSEFTETNPEGLSWNNGATCKWLRTSRGFVSFVQKGPNDLLAELQKALENWQPTPSRLLSAKYRHALNSIGVVAEDKSLAKKYVFAQFYDSIRQPDQNELARKFKIKEHVSRQSEAISFLIEDDLVNFGEKIVQSDTSTGNTYADHYGIDLSDLKTKRSAIEQFNSYVSTLPKKAGNEQLDSGHIFKLGNEWWVCATPACDLQPGQNTIAFTGSSSSLRPFTAMPLLPLKPDELKNDHINSGSCCFVFDQDSGKIVCLGLRTIADETKPATQKVTWRTFIAKNQGLISDGVCKIIQPKLSETKVELPEVDCQVVAKLRYEYALNYIQRVGSSVSRIGLGYVSYPKPPDE